jgi:hypothetical protein
MTNVNNKKQWSFNSLLHIQRHAYSHKRKDLTKGFSIKSCLDSLQNFVHHFDPLIFLLHLFGLKLSGLGGDADVEGDEADHHQKSGQHTRTQSLPQEVQRNQDLKWSTKQKVIFKGKII